LLVFYLADLPRYGGPAVSPLIVGVLTAAFFVAEVSLSPLFGALSDRFGHHLLMQLGPLLGAVAVVMTALSTDLPVLGPRACWKVPPPPSASLPSWPTWPSRRPPTNGCVVGSRQLSRP